MSPYIPADVAKSSHFSKFHSMNITEEAIKWLKLDELHVDYNENITESKNSILATIAIFTKIKL